MANWKDVILGSDAAKYEPGRAEDLIREAERENQDGRPCLPPAPILGGSLSAPEE